MKKLQGIGISGSVAYGICHWLRRTEREYQEVSLISPEAELARFQCALEDALKDLQALFESMKNVDENAKNILIAHKEMTSDIMLLEMVENLVKTGKTSEYALIQARDHFLQLFDLSKDEYIRERRVDIFDITTRILAALLGRDEPLAEEMEGKIIVADRFLPSDILRIKEKKALAYLSRQDSTLSHSAILAKAMGLPCVIQLKAGLDLVHEGDKIVVNGKTGEVILDPNSKTIHSVSVKIQSEKKNQQLPKKHEEIKTTPLQSQLSILANINQLSDLAHPEIALADGIGLVRSEYLFLFDATFPSEAKQMQVYQELLKKVHPKPVTIRTFDFGSDKQNNFLRLEKEDNPAMGYRGIRILLHEKQILRDQLRALFRASQSGNLKILFPMVTDLEQVREIKKIVKSIKRELTAKSIQFDPKVKLGLMIETPAAALISDLLAQEVDFFSIGTNDLSQFALAVDRQNAKVVSWSKADHLAIRRLIEMTVKNAMNAKIKTSVCGTLAENLAMLAFFQSIGIDELSVSPGMISAIREATSQ